MKSELQNLMSDCSIELADIDTRISAMLPLDKGRAYYTQYALIRTCGIIEYVYRSIIADFFNKYSIPQIDQYLDKQIRSGSMGASYQNMIKLLSAFDANWKANFSNSVDTHPDSHRILSSIASLVNNRNEFAHGKAPTATFNDIQQYYSDAMILIQLFDNAVV